MKKTLLLISGLFSLIACGGVSGTSNIDTTNTTNNNGTTNTNINGISNRMMLVSNDIAHDGIIPQDLTGDGLGESPHLKWSNIPVNTEGFEFIMDDPDAMNYVHWNFFVNDANVNEIPRDTSGTSNLPNGIIEGGAGAQQYDPPFPGQGNKHKYRLCIYGLSTTVNTGISSFSVYDNDNFPKDFKSIITGSTCFSAYYTGK